MADIDAIQQRCDAATPGPWEIIGGNEYLTGVGVMVGAPEGISIADAEFIAHARTDIPALLARVRELEAAVQRVRNAVAGDPTTVARAGVVMSWDGPDGVSVDEAVNILADAVIAIDDALRGSDV